MLEQAWFHVAATQKLSYYWLCVWCYCFYITLYQSNSLCPKPRRLINPVPFLWYQCVEPILLRKAVNLSAGFTRNLMPAPATTLLCCLLHHCMPQSKLTDTCTFQMSTVYRTLKLMADTVLLCFLEIFKFDIANLINKYIFECGEIF